MGALLFAAAAAPLSTAAAQDRSTDNAITQADDAFGFSVGRETLGIYNAGSARGFSPTAAGNIRIDGLYFDPVTGLSSLILDTTSIRIGLSAQGYPFAAPSGIVDQSLRRPDEKAGVSIVANADSYGSGGIEVDGSLPISKTLALAYGVSGGHTEFSDGTSNWTHGQGLLLRWHPAPGIEIMPFWMLFNDYDDESGTYYVPSGAYLPPQPKQRRFDGPDWADYRNTGTNHGVLASATLAKNWQVRLGAFRSVYDSLTSYTNLLLDEQPDGSGDRLIIADPRTKSVSLSGELRLTHVIAEGPRRHTFHLSVRERDARRDFGGSDELDLGPTRIGQPVTADKPDFAFGELDHDRVRQATYGFAYDGQWKHAGEFSFSLSRADYRKTTELTGEPTAVSKSQPWLYNATLALEPWSNLALYAGYARGLEESGLAPPTAANRNQPLPAILTEQKDGGFRYAISDSVKLVAGVFDLHRPYFSFDTANRYTQTGTIRSQGAEFSLSGSLTKRLDLVAGGVFLKPRVERQATAIGDIGPKPVAIADHLVNLNLNWRTPFIEGLSLDAVAVHRGSVPATTDNQVSLPPRARVDLGSRYQFKLSGRSATLRVQVSNIFDNLGFGLAGPGIYAANSGRFVTGYLAVDI